MNNSAKYHRAINIKSYTDYSIPNETEAEILRLGSEFVTHGSGMYADFGLLCFQRCNRLIFTGTLFG